MDGQISFDANNLQTYDPVTGVGIITEDINISGLDKTVDVYPVANANKSSIAGDPQNNRRTITQIGTIVGSSVSDLAARVDAFNAYFLGKDKNLDLGWGGSTRRFIATTEKEPTVNPSGKKRYAKFSIQYVCAEPYGMDTSSTALWTTKTAYTGATFTETPTIGGSAPVQLPIFTITLTSFTGAGDYLQISNDNNNQEILLYGLGLAAGDVIVIDSAKRKVTVNGTEVNYIGTFIELTKGLASITYTDGFTTRSVNISASYVKRYK